MPTEFFHFRNKDGADANIVIEQASGIVTGIEMKAAASVNLTDLRRLSRLRQAASGRFVRDMVLYGGETSLPFGDRFHAAPLSRLWRTP